MALQSDESFVTGQVWADVERGAGEPHLFHSSVPFY